MPLKNKSRAQPDEGFKERTLKRKEKKELILQGDPTYDNNNNDLQTRQMATP